MKHISLSDEADIARCESCEDDFNRDDGVDAECCGGWYCHKCWKIHSCNQLVAADGLIVQVGHRLRHIGDDRVYQVSEIVPTMTKGQTCVGEKVLKTKLDGKRHTMRVRLMEHA